MRRVPAQEAVLTGTVTDSTGGVLPGVTITATKATGNTFVAVTDGTGAFQAAGARRGLRESRSEMPGFQTVIQSDVQLLLGQRGHPQRPDGARHACRKP